MLKADARLDIMLFERVQDGDMAAKTTTTNGKADRSTRRAC